MTRKSSSGRWLKEHFADTYVKKAKKTGYRSRSAYKLIEIQKRDHLFIPGMIVVDLGAAPGGWSQVVSEFINPGGQLIAVDKLSMDPIDHVEFIQGDFSEENVFNQLKKRLSSLKVDWVISDMAPNVTGIADIDVPRSIYLVELALDFALKVLNPKGGIFVKVFQGEGVDALVTEIKRHFKQFAIRKPKASRGRSREMFILARGLKN